jgi:phosphoribosylamine--glycine ligase
MIGTDRASGPRVIVLGSGGREHALCVALARDGAEVWCGPGNPGTAQVATNLAVDLSDAGLEATVARCLELHRERSVEVVVVGPEGPLCAGITDRLMAAGLPVAGPTAAAAAIEGSKRFAKELLVRVGVPTARFAAFDDAIAARRYVERHGAPCVVKADGLAAGKGVVVCDGPEPAYAAIEALMEQRSAGSAGAQLVIEERLVGREVSVIALVDGERWQLLPPAEDHKAVFDGDRGPNTGGMGAISPTPAITPAEVAELGGTVFAPVVRELARQGHPFRGALFAGLMMVPGRGPQVLEFNCRFGDPETQTILPRLGPGLLAALRGIAVGRLPDETLPVVRAAAATVVACAEGYPGRTTTGDVIDGLDEPTLHLSAQRDVWLFHAGTGRAAADGPVVTAGGRVLAATGLGDSLAQARERAYQRLATVRYRGKHHRGDIGLRPPRWTEP